MFRLAAEVRFFRDSWIIERLSRFLRHLFCVLAPFESADIQIWAREPIVEECNLPPLVPVWVGGILMSDRWFRNIPLEFLFRSAEFLHDARELVAVADEQFDALVSALRNAEGFLNKARLRELVNGVVKESSRDALFNFILNLSRDDLGSPDTVVGAMEASVRQANSDDEHDKDSRRFRTRVDELRGPFPALQSQVRAERLGQAIGHTLVTHRFVTDLRPVFNEERDLVEGVFPLTTLRLVSIGSSAQHECELVLTEEDLNELRTSAELACQKVDVLKQLLEDKNIPMPSIGMTKGASNDLGE